MKIIKRSGTEVIFDMEKILAAVEKANISVVDGEQMTQAQIQEIGVNVADACKKINRSLSVEEIQDLVEDQIMAKQAYTVARKYITYRYKRELVRKSNSTDDQMMTLLACKNEEVKQAN